MGQVVVELSGDEARLFRSYQRIIDQSKKLDGALKDNKKASNEAFGDSAAAQMTAFAARLSGVGAAAAATTSYLKAVREEIERGKSAMSTYASGLGQLAQLADTPGQLAALTGAAKRTYAEGGARSLDQAAALQFALESAGAGAYRADFSRMQATGLVPNAQAMAESASKLQKAFGVTATGNFRDIASAAFGAASTGLGSVEQILGASAVAGAQAARIGLTPEETMAAIATISGTLGPEEAGTALRQLAKSIEVEAIQGGYTRPGQNLAGYLKDIKAAEGRGARIFDVLGGRLEAVGAYGLLTNESGAAQLPGILRDTLQARSTDALGRKLELAGGLPETAAAAAGQRADAYRGLRAAGPGGIALLADALAADMEKEYERRYGRFGRLAGRAAIGLDRLYGYGDESFINRRAGEWASDETRQAMEIFRAGADSLKAAADNLNQNVSRSRASANQQVE